MGVILGDTPSNLPGDSPSDTPSDTPPPTQSEEVVDRKALGRKFGVSTETIRLWEEKGQLIEMGWRRKATTSKRKALYEPIYYE